jgi:hypothetical protein
MALRFSIVVSTFNRAESLARTLESFRALEYPAFEVIVVNGPSTDDTEAVLESFGTGIKTATCPSRNLSESRNIGIRLASGDVVAFIDDDAYPDPAWVDRLAEGFSDDEVAAVGGPVYDHTGARLQARYSLATRFGDARVSNEVNPTDFLNAPSSHEFVYTIGTNSAFRYDCLVEVGAFDEEYEYYLDETDLCCRLVDRGWVVKALDDGFVYHKFLESDVRTPNRAIRNRFSVLKNKCYFALKHALPMRSFYELCQNLVAAVEHHRGDFRWNVENGLLTAEDIEQFERDVHAAFNVALERYRSGVDKTRPTAWFGEEPSPFVPFRTIRARDDKLHLCFFSQEYPPGPVNGIARVIHTLATGLAAHGHLVRVFTRGEDHNRVDLEDRVWVHRLAIGAQPQPESLKAPPEIWNYAESLRQELHRVHAHRRVDIVEAPNWDSEALAVLLDGGFPTVVGLYTPLSTVRSIDPAVARNPNIQAMMDLERFCYRHAQAFRAADSSIVARVQEEYGIALPDDRIALIPHGLADVTAGVLPTRHEGRVNVLFVGRLEKRKGIDTLLDCIPGLVERFPDLFFTIVGDDGLPGDGGTTYREAFERSAPGARAAGCVLFTGRIDDDERQRLYAGCDIFVAPSRSESFGLILVEAMMFGKPVVAGDNAGMRAIVEDGGNGYVVSPTDASALSEAIADLAVSPERRAAFGARSRELYEQRFSMDRMVQDTNRFYDALVGRPTARTGEPQPSVPRPLASPGVVVRLAPAEISEAKATDGIDPAVSLSARMRCPVCHGGLRADGQTLTEDGHIKTGRLVCLACQVTAAEIEHFKYDFHARHPGVPAAPAPVVVPALGERRVRPGDPAVDLVGLWHEQGPYHLSEGRLGDAVIFRGPFTDASVRLLRNPWSGIVDLFLDDELVESVDLFMPEGSQVMAVPVATDLPFAARSILVRPRGTSNAASRASQVLVEEIVLAGPKQAGFADPTPINRGNPFPDRIERELAATSESELILECGGGDRRRARRNHLNFEYLKYELADLYGDIHAIPFKDDTFGLVFSQAVFEHVRNPFEAAEELIRVTRPGGIIITEVAFLQPLHAVPYHFFNMTTWGVEELFKSCTLLETDWFGELSVTVEWLLRSVNLADKVEPERLRRLVGEFEELDRLVSHEDLKAAASGVYLVARKDHGR